MIASPSYPTQASSHGLHTGEEGMLSLASLFVVLGFLVLIGLLGNAGLVTARKLETQNAADAAAYSGGVEMARGMNSITAINHLIGELTAIVILIHSLGGDLLDQPGQQGTKSPGDDGQLEFWYNAASDAADVADVAGPGPGGVRPFDYVYNAVSQQNFQVDGALFKSYMRLKQVLTWTYQCLTECNIAIAAAEAATDTGIGAIIGGPASIAAYLLAQGCHFAFELKVYQEWEMLSFIEMALNPVLNTFKQTLRDTVIPAMYAYEEGMVLLYSPTLLNPANKAATGVGTPNQADCSLYPLYPQLPVQKEPQQLSDPNKSQLMRATAPWVWWWRQAWMDFGRNSLVLSRFAANIQDQTNYYMQGDTSIVSRLRQGFYKRPKIQLYILKDLELNSIDKTQEKWMNNNNNAQANAEAEKLFTLMGFAHRPAPPLFSNGIFRQENPDGIVCYAQAMIYNANLQDPKSTGDSVWQPIAGWDTLNWSNRVPEFRPVGSSDGCPNPFPNLSQAPAIQLNWQCKLIPTTRLTEATTDVTWLLQPKSIRTVLGRTVPDQWYTLPRTH